MTSNKSNIEKDIHLLESYVGMTDKMTDNQGRPKLDQAIEHILEDYKRVLEENKLAKQTLITQCNVADERNQLLKENKELKEENNVDYMSVYLKGIYDEREKWERKIKTQIKELEEKQKSNKNYNMADWEDTDVYTEIILNLQDLLERRK